MALFRTKLFGNDIEAACSYCQNGSFTQDGKAILCAKSGVVAPYYHCRRFVYDPLARVPKPLPPLSKHQPEEFSL